MVIAAVDPNKKDLKVLIKYLRMVFPDCELVMFSDPSDAEKYIRDNPIDVLFTEAVMLGMTGFNLQTACETIQPAMLTVFVTGTNAYVREAIKSRAQGYIVKPVTRDALRESMDGTRFADRYLGSDSKCHNSM